MPSEEKAVKLSQARTLYNDLRYRIEGAVTNQIATAEETMEIINEYNKEEDEGMIFNANFVASAIYHPDGSDRSDPGFMTDDSVEDIIEAYTSGKNVVIKLIMNEEINNVSGYYPPNEGGYITIIGYQYAFTDNEGNTYDSLFQFDGWALTGLRLDDTAYTLDNGKLFFPAYTD